MHLISEVMEHICNLQKIVKLSSIERDLYMFLLMHNRDFENRPILYKKLTEYVTKDRKNITPHIQNLDCKRVLTLTYEDIFKDGKVINNVMHIQIHPLETVELLLNKQD